MKKLRETGGPRFSDKELTRLMIPLIIEQFLAIAVGMADSLMVAGIGESAVSAVSLVDTVNVLLVNAFTALATGGAVVSGQFLGRRDGKKACEAAEQLIVFSAFVAVVITAGLYIAKGGILGGLFGNVDAEVMRRSDMYYSITEASIPFLAIYSAGAALFRMMGNSKVSMNVSLLMNGVNIAGNAALLYGFGFDVDGAAIPTLFSRIVAAAVVVFMLRKQSLPIHISKPFRYRINGAAIRNIVRLGIPNGLESSMFQLGKILLLSVASVFGTAAIAANAIGNTIAMFEVLIPMSIGVGLVTVVSRCAGAEDFEAARFYTKKLMIWAYALNAGFVAIILVFTPQIVSLYGVSPEAADIAGKLIWMHGAMSILLWPMSFTLPQALKGAGDMRYTMFVAAGSMWIFRVIFGIWFARGLGFGIIGIWLAMFIDWLCRIVFFTIRYHGHRWETKLIGK